MSKQIFYMPFSLKFLFLLILITIFGLGSLFLGVIVSAFMKIGFSAEDALLILFLSLIGSGINIPLTTLKSDIPAIKDSYVKVFGISYRIPTRQMVRNETSLAINVGGASYSCTDFRLSPYTIPFVLQSCRNRCGHCCNYNPCCCKTN